MRGSRTRRGAVDGRLLALSPQRPVVFVLRALGLGDLLTAVPALRAIRRCLCEHELVLAAPSMYEPLVRLAGAADRVFPLSGLQETPRGELRPDIAVNLHGRGPQSHRLLAAMSPSRLIAYAHADHAGDGPSWRSDEHEVARWCRLVAESLQVPVDPGDLRLSPPDTGPRVGGAVVIHPGAAQLARRWPAERFAAVASWAADRGMTVVVTGSSEERDLATRVAEEAGLPDDAVLAGRLTLTELAALVSQATLLVSGDTGVAHLATAYGTPSVVLFGPTPPSLWGPPVGSRHVALWHGKAPGDPWGATVDPALRAISPTEVIAAAETMLTRSKSAAAPETAARQ